MRKMSDTDLRERLIQLLVQNHEDWEPEYIVKAADVLAKYIDGTKETDAQ